MAPTKFHKFESDKMHLNPTHEFITYPLPDTYQILKIKQKKVNKENNEK